MTDYDDRIHLLVEPGETGPRFTPVPSCGHGTHRCYTESFVLRPRDPELTALLEFSRVHWSDCGPRRGVSVEPIVITSYRPESDPQLANDWQQFIDSVASFPRATCTGD